MRMWMVPVHLLCRKHLLGEHGELHKHRHSFVKKHNMDGRLDPVVQIEPRSMAFRHDELAAEMMYRGYRHKSPYTQPSVDYLGLKAYLRVDREAALVDLCNRCDDCRARIAMEYELVYEGEA